MPLRGNAKAKEKFYLTPFCQMCIPMLLVDFLIKAHFQRWPPVHPMERALAAQASANQLSRSLALLPMSLLRSLIRFGY